MYPFRVRLEMIAMMTISFFTEEFQSADVTPQARETARNWYINWSPFINSILLLAVVQAIRMCDLNYDVYIGGFVVCPFYR